MDRVWRSVLSPLRRRMVVGVSSAGVYFRVYAVPTSTVEGGPTVNWTAPKAEATRDAPAKRV